MKIYQKGDRIPVRAQQMWIILTAQAVLKPDGGRGWSRGIISYGGLATQMGMNEKAAFTFSRHLGLLGFYCQQEKLPPINVIVVNGKTGIPGDGVVETEGYTKDQKKVLEEDWFSYRPPSIKALRDVYDEHIAGSLVE